MSAISHEPVRHVFHGIGIYSRARLDLPPLTSDDSPICEAGQITINVENNSHAPGKLEFDRCSERKIDCYGKICRIAGTDDHFLLTFDEGDWLSVGGDQITVYQRFVGQMVSLDLIRRAICVWSEIRGIPVLHAACVEIGDRAVGFFGSSGTGKSTLVAALMANGHGLISDDMLLLNIGKTETSVNSGLPQARLWPDIAQLIVEDPNALPRVHPSTEKRYITSKDLNSAYFVSGSRKLGGLYLLDRSSLDSSDSNCCIRFEVLRPVEALLTLIANSYDLEFSESLETRQQRFHLLSQLVMTIPVTRIRYPTDPGMLFELAEAVVRDFRDHSNFPLADYEAQDSWHQSTRSVIVFQEPQQPY